MKIMYLLSIFFICSYSCLHFFYIEFNWRTCRSGLEDLHGFFEDLNNSDLSEDGKVLTIPSTNEGIPPYEFYVRECWVKIYNLIYKGYKYGDMHDFVVTGSPGIGKSLFSYYAMWRCMKEENFSGFYWETEKGRALYYSPLHGISIVTVRKYRSIPHFVDLQEKTTPSFLCSPCRVLFSSHPDRIKAILKGDNAKGFVQPPWTLTEILDAHSRIRRYRENVDLNTVKSQFHIYGGVPRYVFVKRANGDGAMRAAIDVKEAYIIGGRMYSELLVRDDDISHMIMHLYPINNVDYSFDFPILLPASPWVVYELKRRNILTIDAKNVGYVTWRQESSKAEYFKPFVMSYFEEGVTDECNWHPIHNK